MRLALLLAALSLCSRAVKSQLIEIRNVGGKQIECMHSGLSSDLSDCGVQSDWYTYVFVGSISAIAPAKENEEELKIVPQEVFSGIPENPMTVLTSQAPCLPKLAVGDRWLFYLRKVKDQPIVLDYYGNVSRPVADVQQEIETLRRLQTIGDFGILRGTVWHGAPLVGKGVSHASVFAQRESDGAQFVTKSDANGRYEFQPLPPGKYKITFMPSGAYHSDDSEIELKHKTCSDFDLTSSPRGEIGGQVRSSSGLPVPNIDVILMSSDNSWYVTTQTDRDGYYKFSGIKSGQFVVGLNFPARSDWFNGGGAGTGIMIPPASVFYPGVASSSRASVIALAVDEQRDDLNFIIPAQ
jgi:Carboxypeptidase regulatory-like domain